MPIRPSTVQRAFELAASGRHTNVETLRRQLNAEGYFDGDLQMSSKYLRRQLRRAMAGSKASRAAEPVLAQTP